MKPFESDPRFCSVVTATKSKWLERFPEIPTIYCAATILDPRMKIEGLRQLLVYYYESLGVNYDVDEKVAILRRLCNKSMTVVHALVIMKPRLHQFQEKMILRLARHGS